MARRLPLEPLALLRLVRALREGARRERPLVVAGAPEPAAALRRELARGGVEAAVRDGPAAGAAAAVQVLAATPAPEDEAAFREALEAGVPVLCVLAGPAADEVLSVPLVPDEAVVRVRGGGRPAAEQVAEALARILGDDATPLAARLPALRRPVCRDLIRRISRENGIVGAAVFVPGADFALLTLNQVRLVLRIADAHGLAIAPRRIPEVLAVLGAGVGTRRLARQLLGLVPVAGWAVKGAVAYSATRALGEAALRYFEHRAPVTRTAAARRQVPPEPASDGGPTIAA